jgi:3'-phosphoadenosine 5'-phosphosulfate (PAPS) 3'-phosphatase
MCIPQFISHFTYGMRRRGTQLLKGLGGVMTRLDGSPLDYNRKDLLVGDFIAKAS